MKVRSSIIIIRRSIIKVRSSIITVGWGCEWHANVNQIGGYKASHSFIIKWKIVKKTLTRNCCSGTVFAPRKKVINGDDNGSGEGTGEGIGEGNKII